MTKSFKNLNSPDLEKKMYELFLPITRNIRYPEFELKLEQADIAEDMDLYLSRWFFYAALAFVLILFCGGILAAMFSASISFGTILILSIVALIGISGFGLFNPYMIVGSKVTSIKINLPLVILGMSSVAESGAPPEAIFSTTIVKGRNEYLSTEFSKIIYYIDNLGISLLEAIDLVAKKTPSYELRKFLLDLKSNIESGGSLPEFMKKKADHARFEYKLMLDNQNKKADAFGDIYSTVVIAGPLFIFSGIMLLGMVGSGGIAGLSISVLVMLGVFLVVPLINIIFIIIINLVG